MRTTLHIDDDLLSDLRRQAAEHNISLSELLNRMIRQSLAPGTAKRAPFRQTVHSLGIPHANLDKALALSADIADDEAVTRLHQRP